jgi:2,3-bisphosphoglycerate-independent phosphoglycerate mutase
MKGIFVILDGVGDLPHRQLKGKTPLEVANTPHLDFLATRGEMGYMYPIKPGFVPGSDEALVTMFGNGLLSSTRGQLEAKGAGLKVTRGDLALRANFGTVGDIKKSEIIDRRAGRTLTTAESEILSKAINKIKLPAKFEFKSSVQHRGALVFRGGFSDNFSGNDPHPFTGKFRACKPLDDEENTHYTVNIVNEFLGKVHEVLDKHPINEARKEKGLMPANYLFVRCPGIEIPKLKQYKKWISIVGMPLEVGFSKLSGMNVLHFDYPKLKNLDAYANLYDALKKRCKFAIKSLKKNYKKADYAYIHIKETDLPGHDNKPLEKKNMIEYVDQTLFKFLRNFAPKRDIKIVVTADHSTPCKLKHHSADPVPVLFYNGSIPREKHFSEKEARGGTLGSFMGNELLKKVKFVK